MKKIAVILVSVMLLAPGCTGRVSLTDTNMTDIINAWDIGAICEFFNAYALSELDFNNNFTCATDLVAHELGHKLGEFAPTRTFRGHGGRGKR